MNKKRILLIILLIVFVIIGVVLYFFVFGPKYYTITFDSNGGTIVESQRVKEGNYIDIPIDPMKKDSLFLGWNLNGLVYNFNDRVMSDLTLTAAWINNKDILFNGKYLGKNRAYINIYDFEDKRVQIKMVGYGKEVPSGGITRAVREINAKNDNGIINFKIRGETFSIKRNKYDIVLETTDTENFTSGIYERDGIYSTAEFFKDSFYEADIDAIDSNEYNSLYIRNDGQKLYMFDNGLSEEIVFISPSGKRTDIRLLVDYNENGERKLVPKYDEEYYRLEYNDKSNEFTVTEYDGKGNKIVESSISGNYKFEKYLNGETIIKELQYLDLNGTVIVDNN